MRKCRLWFANGFDAPPPRGGLQRESQVPLGPRRRSVAIVFVLNVGVALGVLRTLVHHHMHSDRREKPCGTTCAFANKGLFVDFFQLKMESVGHER